MPRTRLGRFPLDASTVQISAFFCSQTISARQSAGSPSLTTADLAGLPDAIRSRVLRSAAVAAGGPPGALTLAHVHRVEELVTNWHGQRWGDLPGGVRAARRDGQVLFTGGVAHGRQ